MNNNFIPDIYELMNEGRFEEAAEKIKSIDDYEISEELICMLAHCLSHCSEYREAIEELEKLDDYVSEDSIAYHFELANANHGLYKYSTAIEEAKRCVELDDECIDAWLLLCLMYQETGRIDEFERASAAAKEIDEEAWNEVFCDDIYVGEMTDLAFYSEQEENAVLDFIHKKYGEFGMMLPNFEFMRNNDEEPIKVGVVPPDEEMPFFKLITVGIGAYRGKEITDDGEEKAHRVEFIALIPRSGSCDDDVDLHIWVSKIMRQFGEMIQAEKSWIGCGHTVSYGSKLDESVDYDGVIFIPDIPGEEKCLLPDGEEVEFMLLVPLYEEEILFKLDNGFVELLDKATEKLGGNFVYVVKKRENIFEENREKKWAIPKSSIRDILDWDGPDGCYATDRITVDNRRIGIMYREKPQNKLDSGWRFLAGDEDMEYMSNIKNAEIFRLNTICNYNPEIIEYLENPVGCAFYRNKSGEFCPMEFFPK